MLARKLPVDWRAPRGLPVVLALVVIVCVVVLRQLLLLPPEVGALLRSGRGGSTLHGLRDLGFPAPLLYAGLRRAALQRLARPLTTAAGALRALHWAGVATGTAWASARPLEAIAAAYPLACAGAPSPTLGELSAALDELEASARVVAVNSSKLFIGPHWASWRLYRPAWTPAPLAALVQRATRAHGRPPSVINLGAGSYDRRPNDPGDGRVYDPTYDVLMRYPGGHSVLIEADASSLASTVTHLEAGGARGITGVPALITPATVVRLLRDAGAASEPDLLKVDIDGFDCAVVSEVLGAGFSPRVIAVEVNPDFPPPLLWEVGYSASFKVGLRSAVRVLS